MIENILNSVSKVLNRLTSNKQLFPYEQLALNAWRETLSVDSRRVLDEQIIAAELMQRQAGGAKVCFYYSNKNDIPRFATGEKDVHVATIVLVNLNGNTKQSMRVKLYLVKGRFFSIEFPKRPDRYVQQHNMQLESLHVASVETHCDVEPG